MKQVELHRFPNYMSFRHNFFEIFVSPVSWAASWGSHWQFRHRQPPRWGARSLCIQPRCSLQYCRDAPSSLGNTGTYLESSCAEILRRRDCTSPLLAPTLTHWSWNNTNIIQHVWSFLHQYINLKWLVLRMFQWSRINKTTILINVYWSRFYFWNNFIK